MARVDQEPEAGRGDVPGEAADLSGRRHQQEGVPALAKVERSDDVVLDAEANAPALAIGDELADAIPEDAVGDLDVARLAGDRPAKLGDLGFDREAGMNGEQITFELVSEIHGAPAMLKRARPDLRIGGGQVEDERLLRRREVIVDEKTEAVPVAADDVEIVGAPGNA